ncbi:MAG: hypothetical protein F4215_13250 [Gemmatimonadetes bacterium]|nr:hypothetical protein [Gemmatimonadota bacterium]
MIKDLKIDLNRFMVGWINTVDIVVHDLIRADLNVPSEQNPVDSVAAFYTVFQYAIPDKCSIDIAPRSCVEICQQKYRAGPGPLTKPVERTDPIDD